MGATGCVRNLPRYQGLAGLARRSENARRGTAEVGEGERQRSGGERGGLSRTVLQSANVGEAGLRWGQMVGCEERRGERERKRGRGNEKRSEQHRRDTLAHSHTYNTLGGRSRWAAGWQWQQLCCCAVLCFVAPLCILSLRLAGGRQEAVRAVLFRPSALGCPPITATDARAGSWQAPAVSAHYFCRRAPGVSFNGRCFVSWRGMVILARRARACLLRPTRLGQRDDRDA